MITPTQEALYLDLLCRYLAAPSNLEREKTLMAAESLSRTLLSHSPAIDDLLGLHTRTTGHLVDRWSEHATLAAHTPHQHSWSRLIRGDTLPVMLALLLPLLMDEQRKAEQRWHAEHARRSAVFAQTDDLVLMFDTQGHIEYLNPAFTRATGWTLEHAATQRDHLWQTPLPASGTQHVETLQQRQDGSHFLASWSISPIHDQDGTLINHVVIGHDISHQRQLDEALRQNDHLRAVATLAAGIAHDFNNVLGSIQGLTEVCQALSPADSPLLRPLAGIHRASLRAAELVHQLQGFARELPFTQQTFEVAPWLEALEPLFTASLPHHVMLRLRADPDLHVHADPSQLEQVTLNLVKNAGYAMRHHGGWVDLLADTWDDPLSGHAWVRLRVIDRGEGIAPDTLPRIFEPFFTTKPVDEGTGLGLSAAHGIVHQHRGQLTVESELGVGTTFTVLLPRVVRQEPL